MRMNPMVLLTTMAVLVAGVIESLPAEGQVLGGIGRRVARQAQRQVNRADYYAPQTWQQLSPWIEQNRVAPLARAANAVRETVDAATAVGDGQYGYSDRDQANAWFYDYYSYTPTYYTYDSGDRYASAVRYFDGDGDGVYDSRASYRDSDDDGRYDEYDRYDFYSQDATSQDAAETRSERQSIQDDSYYGPEDAERYSVEGEIHSTKKATVNGSDNLILGVTRQEGDKFVVDVGPVDSLRGSSIEVGAMVSASGPLETIGDKQVLIADSFRVRGGDQIEVRRTLGTPLSGRVVDVKTTTVENADHYFAIVESEGERQLVDLGPTRSYKMEITPSTEVSLQGIPVRVQQNRVLMATQVRIGGQTITINPDASRNR